MPAIAHQIVHAPHKFISGGGSTHSKFENSNWWFLHHTIIGTVDEDLMRVKHVYGYFPRIFICRRVFSHSIHTLFICYSVWEHVVTVWTFKVNSDCLRQWAPHKDWNCYSISLGVSFAANDVQERINGKIEKQLIHSNLKAIEKSRLDEPLVC